MKNALIIFLLGSPCCVVGESPLKVDLRVVKKEEKSLFHFTIRNLSDDVFLLEHLNFSDFRWQFKHKGELKAFDYRIAKSIPRAYVFVEHADISFTVTTDDHITGMTKDDGEDQILLFLCSVKSFQEKGFKAFSNMVVPLSVDLDSKFEK